MNVKMEVSIVAVNSVMVQDRAKVETTSVFRKQNTETQELNKIQDITKL